MLHIINKDDRFVDRKESRKNYLEKAREALANGCTYMMLGLDDLSDEEFMYFARPIKALCDVYHSELVIVDRYHLVKRLKANGVYLRNKTIEMISKARQEMGCRYMITCDAADETEAMMMHDWGVDFCRVV